ncbi:MAG: hypothetical protein LDLANPLL_02658 [Turneriella sp.]|nr:hypothetical protein [Turneriella sp.]
MAYIKGILSILRVGLILFTEGIWNFLRTRAIRISISIILFFLLLSFTHHFATALLGKIYAALDAKNSSIARMWRSVDAQCSLSFCRSLFPSPIAYYELEVKEEIGFKKFISALKEQHKEVKISPNATEAQKFIASYIPNRAFFYGGIPSLHNTQNITAVYLTGTSARPSKVDKYLRFSRAQRLNGICFDIKDVYGFVNYKSNLAEVKTTQGKTPPPLGNLAPLVAYFKTKKVYTIARIAMFQDELMAQKFPERQIKLQNGAPLLTKGRTVWVDPNKKSVQEYNLRIIREVLQAGVDEIQLDYIRYPAEGDWKVAVYHGVNDSKDKPVVLGTFLQKVHSLTLAYGARLSLDVFGVVAWQEALDIKSTGQDMHVLSQTADTISPMLYPSHFGHVFGGVTNPADKPALFLEEGVTKLRAINNKIIIRPWLQAFKWRVTHYSSEYITEQIRGSKKAGGQGYLLWNAGNIYEHFSDPVVSASVE